MENKNLIGKGVCASVYADTDNNCAIKFFREYNKEDKHVFFIELYILKSLNHPNLISVIDFNIHKGIITLPLGLCTLDDVPKERFTDAHFNKNTLKQLLTGTKYLHENNIWHLDIKPTNILVFPNDNIKLIDFSHSEHIPYQGYTTSCRGTISLVPPEWLSNEESNENYDIWTIGVTLLLVRGLYNTWGLKWSKRKGLSCNRNPSRKNKRDCCEYGSVRS